MLVGLQKSTRDFIKMDEDAIERAKETIKNSEREIAENRKRMLGRAKLIHQDSSHIAKLLEK